MTKFRIELVTKQYWKTEVEAENLDEAKKIRDDFYEYFQRYTQDDVQQMQFMNDIKFQLDEFFGGDDLSDDDITDLSIEELPEADRADLVVTKQLSFNCPYCNEEIILSDSDSCSMADDVDGVLKEMDKGKHVYTCPDCEKRFILNAYKEY